jgi:flavin-binding protein dodecin
MSSIAKVIEVIGSSESNWEDVVEVAVQEASKTIRNISGVEVTNMTAEVNENRITSWRATVKVAFGIEDETQAQYDFDSRNQHRVNN